MTREEFVIRYVALYLRKSRGEEDTDLEKHRYVLREMCVKHGWKYVEYVEIANSETIEYRPKFQNLLSDVEEGIFDAVLVVDYQRLGRGELEDQGKIKRIFRDSETYIVTPEKIYNLVDDTDDLLVDVRGLLARQEYKTTSKNLQRGKKIGARLGNWTNGTPPYPYRYSAERKGLIVDTSKITIYRELKEATLEGAHLNNLAIDLNIRGIPGPKGGLWHGNTIRRILLDRTHLGQIISNKTKGSGHKKKKTKPLVHIPQEEWTVVENCHEALKTEDEHMRLVAILEGNRIIPRKARAGRYPLTGLVFCGKCGRMIRYDVRTDGYPTSSLKKCIVKNAYGVKCDNPSIRLSVLHEFIFSQLNDYEQKILDSEGYINDNFIERLTQKIQEKEQHLAKVRKALTKIKEMYEFDEYTREEYEDRRDKRQSEVTALETEIAAHRHELNYDLIEKNKERKIIIKSFKDIWTSDTATDTEKNEIARQLISRIEYVIDKEIANLSLSIEFK